MLCVIYFDKEKLVEIIVINPPPSEQSEKGISGLQQEETLCTFGINGLDLICGFAGPACSESVQGSDSVGVPLALSQTRHLAL